MNLAARLFQCGIMKYLDQDELTLYMTDLCYHSKAHDYNRDKDFVNEMVNVGQIKIIELNSSQVERASKLLQRYYPKFVLKTVSSMVSATDLDFILLSEDALLRETVSKDFGVVAQDKTWLTERIINSLSNKENGFNPSMLRLII
ncbi:hypothetical protein V3R08_10130 [Flavobacterium oreochromis]